MAAVGSLDRRSSRYMGLLYVVLVLVLVLVAIRALRPPQPPPPPTAEFAPQAVQELKQAPQNQTSNSGRGPGGQGGQGGLASPAPAPSPQTIIVPRVKPCASALTQIPDTQSAPCIPYWTGNNGGATWAGVTRDSIFINMPDTTWDADPYSPSQHETRDVVQYLNNHYELYDRKVVVVHEWGCGSDPSGMQANADKYAKLPIFASTGCGDAQGKEAYYYDRLANDRVVSIGGREDQRTESHFQRYAPFEWNYAPSLDVIEDEMGSLACKLKGQRPSFTSPNPLWSTRKFGLVYSAYTNAPQVDISEIKAQLSGCGIDVSKDTLPITEADGSTTDQSVVESGVAVEQQLSQDQVTSVICVCHISSVQVLQRQADSGGYLPEWLLSSYEYNDQEENELDFQQSQQWSHVIETSVWNKYVPEAERPWYQAVREVDPAWTFDDRHPGADDVYYQYRSLLVLFNGLQMAGPILTPYTFSQGLLRTHFPNPPSPIYEGGVGFNTDGLDTHTFVKDTALIWVSQNTPGTEQGSSGSFCYLHNGARVAPGRFPDYATGYYNFQQPPCST